MKLLNCLSVLQKTGFHDGGGGYGGLEALTVQVAELSQISTDSPSWPSGEGQNPGDERVDVYQMRSLCRVCECTNSRLTFGGLMNLSP